MRYQHAVHAIHAEKSSYVTAVWHQCTQIYKSIYREAVFYAEVSGRLIWIFFQQLLHQVFSHKLDVSCYLLMGKIPPLGFDPE